MYIWSTSVHAGFSCLNDVEWKPSNFVLVSVNLSHLASLAGFATKACFNFDLQALSGADHQGVWPCSRALVDGHELSAGCQKDSTRPKSWRGTTCNSARHCWHCSNVAVKRSKRLRLLRARRARRAQKEMARDLRTPCGDLLLDCFLKTPYESEDHRAADISMFLLAGHRQVASLHFASIVWCKLQNAWQKLSQNRQPVYAQRLPLHHGLLLRILAFVAGGPRRQFQGSQIQPGSQINLQHCRAPIKGLGCR